MGDVYFFYFSRPLRRTKGFHGNSVVILANISISSWLGHDYKLDARRPSTFEKQNKK